MKDAIKCIIEENPLRPSETRKETPEEQKRKRDIKNLKEVLDTIHIPTFDYFLEEIPDKLIGKIFYFQRKYTNILESNMFHIYDTKLLELLTKVKDNWGILLSFGQHYTRDNSDKNYKFFFAINDSKAKIDYNTITNISLTLEKDFKDLLYFVRNHYLEIDLNENNEIAFGNYTTNLETKA